MTGIGETGTGETGGSETGGGAMTGAEVFEEHRGLMFAIAYRMLGTAADAEDAVQDAWLRWSGADQEQVIEPKAYLTRIITNTALNKLRAVRARREAYVGPWLPEPVLTAAGPDASEHAELAESVSVALLVVLESLGPEERAAFVLREVFGYPHAEIAAALGRSEASVRQLVHRAREHVQARRPRFDVDRDRQREVTERFLAAAAGGDIDLLMSVLAPDVTLTSDGGGKARAALRTIRGPRKVARFVAGIYGRAWMGVDPADMVITPAELNGAYGMVVTAHERVIAAFTATVVGEHISSVEIYANPDKLGAIATGTTMPLA